MRAQNLPENAAKLNKQSRFTVSNLLPRIAIYSTVIAGIVASFYDFRLDTIALSSDRQFLKEAQIIASINRGQQAYYAENDRFSDTIDKLGLGIKEQGDRYNYTIASSMGPIQYDPRIVASMGPGFENNQLATAQFESTIVIAKPEYKTAGKSYTGAVFAFKDKSSNMITTITAICESDRLNPSYAEIWTPPTFDGREIHCQPGTTMVVKALP